MHRLADGSPVMNKHIKVALIVPAGAIAFAITAGAGGAGHSVHPSSSYPSAPTSSKTSPAKGSPSTYRSHPSSVSTSPVNCGNEIPCPAASTKPCPPTPTTSSSLPSSSSAPPSSVVPSDTPTATPDSTTGGVSTADSTTVATTQSSSPALALTGYPVDPVEAGVIAALLLGVGTLVTVAGRGRRAGRDH